MSRRATSEMLAMVSNKRAPKKSDDPLPSPEPGGHKPNRIRRRSSTPPVVMSTPAQKHVLPPRAAKETAAQREKELKAWISGDPWSHDSTSLL